jgi:hypothetical protein
MTGRKTSYRPDSAIPERLRARVIFDEGPGSAGHARVSLRGATHAPGPASNPHEPGSTPTGAPLLKGTHTKGDPAGIYRRRVPLCTRASTPMRITVSDVGRRTGAIGVEDGSGPEFESGARQTVERVPVGRRSGSSRWKAGNRWDPPRKVVVPERPRGRIPRHEAHFLFVEREGLPLPARGAGSGRGMTPNAADGTRRDGLLPDCWGAR